MERWKKLVAGLVAMAAAVVYATHGHAAAPIQKGQAPGFYRMIVGDFEVTALSDGAVPLDIKKLLTNVEPERVDALFKQAAAQRKKVYADSAQQGMWLAVAHISFPGIGHIRSDGTGYVYYPINYSIPK